MRSCVGKLRPGIRDVGISAALTTTSQVGLYHVRDVVERFRATRDLQSHAPQSANSLPAGARCARLGCT